MSSGIKDRHSLTLSPPDLFKPAEIYIPGSKSYTNRALILASLAQGESTLLSPSESDDSRELCGALQKLGVSVSVSGDSWKVTGRGGNFLPYRGEINVGPAGTTMRFLVSLCSMIEGTDIVLSGSERMHKRPVDALVDALRQIGADIEYTGSQGCPPLRIRGKKLRGGEVRMRGDISSQFFSSMMMCAPLLSDGLVIDVEGEQISKSYIDMTIDGIKAFGCGVINEDYRRYSLPGGGLPQARVYRIEGDASGASYLWGLGAITGVPVRVMNMNPESAQGDIRFPDLLAEMGCIVKKSAEDPGWIEVSRSGELKGITADMSLMPDTAQTLAVIAAFATGETRMTGLSTLKIKETDRIEAVKAELAKTGIRCLATDDTLTIMPGAVHAAGIKTYDDHRMAMSFALLAAKVPNVVIEEPHVVTKSFPDFWERLSSLGIKIS